MKKHAVILALSLAAAFSALAESAKIVCPVDAPAQVKLAAREVRRYIYLRTGELLAVEAAPPPLQGALGSESKSGGGAASTGNISLTMDPSLGDQEYRLRTVGGTLTISGGSPVAVLYGAYAFAEKLGVRFYLHGDVIPDGKIPLRLPQLDETHKPLFTLRGVNPWGSHPFGFDAWGADDYKSIFTQLTKMKMNFLGIHCYPEGHPYAEPTVWHGLTNNFDTMGQVNQSYVSRYFNTLLKPAWGGYFPKKTSDYSFGGAQLFDDEAWAPDVLRGHCPLPVTPGDCDDVFNRMGLQFKDAFVFARQLGVKTCIGTEVPLILPKALCERLKSAGKNPDDPAVKREIYEGTFRRIMASHPLDYYWIWTPEGWTWQGNHPAQYSNTVADVRLAIEALKNVKAPFQLATCGWVLGPQHDRAAFDNDLPKDIPMSAINRNTGATKVDPAFARIKERETWAIPWLESDNRQGLAGIQLEAGRIRRDAVDAHEYGCSGLMGLQWRTEILSPNVSALAQAAWDQSWGDAAVWSLTGQVANYPGATITGTADAPLYRTCRYDLGTIRLRTPSGKYKVTLKFCEPYFSSAGERICDVKLQGCNALSHLDIFAKVGKFSALDLCFDDVAVTNGTLTIELVARKSLPCISAIAVEGPGFTRKINCGGASYQDWQADVETSRSLPVDDFYADWAQVNFGLAEAGKVFAAIDGHVPQVSDGGCPSGSLRQDNRPWARVEPQFAFVHEFEKLRSSIRGAGHLDRFDYWLNTFKYLRALAKVRCAMGARQPDNVMRAWAEAYTCLLATVNSPGAMAMVVNLENHPGWGATIARYSAQPWPKEYQGQPRLIVPTVRNVVSKGEALTLKIIALASSPCSSVSARFRPLGKGEWQAIAAKHVTCGVYSVTLPSAIEDFEYQIFAELATGAKLTWPVTVPEMNQTVIITE